MAEETIPQMRERIDALEKQVKSQNETNTKLQGENRTLKARDAFREQGYDPVHGELFASSSESDITPEAVNEFAGRYGLNPTSPAASDEGPAEAEQGAEDVADGMESFSRAGSGPGTGGAAGPQSDTLTREEYMSLAQSNPAAAKEAVAAGRVQLRADNPWVR